jgi:cell wall-associated NlpC family hydrolase
MAQPTPALTMTLTVTRALAAALAAWLSLAVVPATAQPGAAPAAAASASAPAGGDAVLDLLRDRGLLPPPAHLEATRFVQQVRESASELVLTAMNFLGVPYRRGGNSAEQGFDCSGFTRHVFEHSIGLVLPRRSRDQAQHAGLLPVKRDELKPGDLVFFNTMRQAFSHVGIYVGEGRFIHAPSTGGEVRVEDMRAAYWQRRFNGARRAPVAAAPASPAAAEAPTGRH